MTYLDVEHWPLTRKEVAKIVGLEEAVFANWLNRTLMFAEKRRGSGRALTFVFRDVLFVAGVKALAGAGLEVAEAERALSKTSLYSALLHDGGQKYPGTVSFTQGKSGHFDPVDGPEKVVCIEVRCWPIFDAIWPGFRAAVLANAGDMKRDVSAALDDFKKKIDTVRAERWGPH